MKIEEAITDVIMSDGHGKTTDQIADAINRHGWHKRKDGKPVTSAQVYAVICRYPSIVNYAAGFRLFELKRNKKCLMLHGQNAEDAYAEYITGQWSYMDITLELRR